MSEIKCQNPKKPEHKYIPSELPSSVKTLALSVDNVLVHTARTIQDSKHSVGLLRERYTIENKEYKPSFLLALTYSDIENALVHSNPMEHILNNAIENQHGLSYSKCPQCGHFNILTEI